MRPPVGEWCVNRATNYVGFFSGQRSHCERHAKEKCISAEAPLAVSPRLHCSNVNGGLGVVSWDLLNPSSATSPSSAFPLRQLVSFKGSWPSDWCVIAPGLTCPLTVLFIGQCCFPLSTLCFFFEYWRKKWLFLSLYISYFLIPVLPVGTESLTTSTFPCLFIFHCLRKITSPKLLRFSFLSFYPSRVNKHKRVRVCISGEIVKVKEFVAKQLRKPSPDAN